MKTYGFDIALNALKAGRKITREGWNGKGQFVYLVPADKYPAKTDAAKSIADDKGMVSYRAYLALKTAQGDVATWVPSVSDCLAEDWIIMDEEPREKEAIVKELDGLFTLLLASALAGHKPSEEKCKECDQKDKCKLYKEFSEKKKETKKDKSKGK